MQPQSRVQSYHALSVATITIALRPWFYEAGHLSLFLLIPLTFSAVFLQMLLTRRSSLVWRWAVVLCGFSLSVVSAIMVTDHPPMLIINAVLFFAAFYGGLRIGTNDWQHHDALQLFGLGALSLVLAHGLAPQKPGMALIALFIFFGLLSLASNREEQERFFSQGRGTYVGGSRSWFAVFGALFVVVVSGFVLINDWTTSLVKYIGHLALFILEKAMWLLWPLLYLLEKLAGLIKHKEDQEFLPEFELGREGLELLEKEVVVLGDVSPWPGYVVLGIIVFIVLYAVVRFLAQRSAEQTTVDSGEERESMFTLAELARSLRVPSLRLRRGRMKPGLSKNPRTASEAYAWLLYWCARLGRARRQEETPREFCPVAQSVLRGSDDAVRHLTQAFETEKYGIVSYSPEQLAELSLLAEQLGTVAREIMETCERTGVHG